MATGQELGGTTPVGPVLVTADEWQPGPTIRTVVDGEVVQEASTGDLVFDPAELVSYVSTMITLRPGDIIPTGTPGGVGRAHGTHHISGAPVPSWRRASTGSARLRNRVVAEPRAAEVVARTDQVDDPRSRRRC